MKQILVKGPSEKFYVVEESEGIRTLKYLLNERFKVIQFFAMEDFEEIILQQILFTIVNHTW